MPTLNAMFRLTDGFSSQINKIMNRTDAAMNKMLGASKAADKLNSSFNKTGKMAVSATPKVKSLGDGLDGVSKKANRANSSLKTLIGTAAGMAAVKKGMDIVDSYINTNARLGMITSSPAEQAALQGDIFASANRSRGSYTETANAVAKMRMLAWDSFATNQEAIGFTELLNKSLKASGASQAEKSAAFLQLTQAMAAGKLQGDEFRSIMENAPMVANAISQYMGVSKGKLKELSSQGLITADIIKNAMFSAADDINGKFNSMPMTFADVATYMQNKLFEAFGRGLTKVNGMINSSSFQTLMAGFSQGIQWVASGFNWLVNTITAGGPIVQAFFATAIVMAGIWAAKMLIAAGATMLAHWPLVLIVATIGLVIAALNATGVTFGSIFGYIGGLLGAFYATGYNIIANLWNLFVSFAEFIANVFTNPLAAVVNLFVNMANSVLSIIKSIAEAIDSVFGSNLAGAVGGFSSSLQAWGDGFKNDSYVSLDHLRMDSKSTIGAIQSGMNVGKSVGGFIDNWDFSGITSINPSAGGGVYASTPFGGLGGKSGLGSAGNPATVKGTGAGGAVKVESKEDIDWMRKLAERDYVARIAQNTLAPNIRVEFSGPITKEADTDSVLGHVVEVLKDAIITGPEGVPG